MKATDLMIGDWVQNPLGWKAQVQSIRYVNTIKDDWEWIVKIGINNETFQGNLSLNEIGAIPLTPEILEKNGFTHKYYGIYRLLIGDSLWIDIYKEGGIIKDRRISPEQDYRLPALGFVHELQHALRLCGIEKEIKL